MVIARNVMALVLMVPAVNAIAAAFPVSDLHVATLSLDAAGQQMRKAAKVGPVAEIAAFEVNLDATLGMPVYSALPVSRVSVAPRDGATAGVADNGPVPAALWMFAIGLIGLAGIGRRRSEIREQAAADNGHGRAVGAVANI